MPGIADIIGGVVGIVKTHIDEATAQKYENEHKYRTSRARDILSEPDSNDRAVSIAAFIDELRDTSGSASTRQLSDDNIRVPLQDFQFLIEQCSEAIRDRETLARVTFKI